MISNMTRYKNQVSRISNALKRKIGDKRNFLYIEIALIDSFYNLRVTVETHIDTKDNIKVIEDSSGIVYIGLDLSKFRIGEIPYHNSVARVIKNQAYPNSLYFKNEKLRSDLDGYVSSTDVINDFRAIERTPVYDNICDALHGIHYDSEVLVELKDKEFPKLEVRNFLPILILDFEKKEANYSNDMYSDSYRKNRSRCSINDIMGNINFIIRDIPFNLLKGEIKHKYIKNSKY